MWKRFRFHIKFTGKLRVVAEVFRLENEELGLILTREVEHDNEHSSVVAK